MQKRVPRLRTVREKLPVRSDYHAIQPARIQLYEMHGLRYLRRKMPVEMYIGSRFGQELVALTKKTSFEFIL